MAAERVLLAERMRRARGCAVLGASTGARDWQPRGCVDRSTRLGKRVGGTLSGKIGGELWIALLKIAFTSSGAPICGRRDRPIRKKIIGHAMPVLQRRTGDIRGFWRVRRALPLLHQPAREHGRGVLLNPLIEKGADLLAEIGGMTETREFIALQRDARSREKELPRGLGLGTDHVGLLKGDCRTVTWK
jgi:hypothetical protein